MNNINTLVIGSKNHLKRIQPYLRREYLFCNENKVLYNADKWKSEKILKFCANNNIKYILFVSENFFLRELSHILRAVSSMGIKTYYIPQYSFSSILSTEKLKQSILEFDINKPRLNYLEFHVADHCNLN